MMKAKEKNPTELTSFFSFAFFIHQRSLLCGVIRGALEQIAMKVDVSISKDPLKGDDRFELHMKLNEYESEEYPFKDD